MAQSAPVSASASNPVSVDNWDPHKYGTVVAPFASKLTTRVVSLLDLQPDDTLLDIGCGDGVLTSTLAARCAHITGIDSSPNMVSACPAAPNTSYIASSALSLPPLPHAPYSKLFSNAALHWILRTTAEERAGFFARAFTLLRPGGAFVAECGAHGNMADIHAAIIAALLHRGVDPATARGSSPWWFGTVEEYRALLEGAGFTVELIETELRQTQLTSCEGGGVGGMVRLFAAEMLKCLPEDQWDGAVKEIEDVMEGVGRRSDGGMWANYVRLRFVARRPGIV